MSFILNTDEVAATDRAEFVHEALGTTMVPIELHWIGDRPGATAHGVITDLGDLTVCSGQTTAFRVDRTPSLARDDMEPSIFVNLQLSGTSMVVQHGREAILHPGALVIYDSTAPYTLLNDTGMTGEFFRIPHASLAMPHDAIRRACAVSLSPQHPVTSLTYDYLRRLAADPALRTASHAESVGHPSVELVRAVIATHLRNDGAADPLASTLALRILEFARAHLADPDLGAEMIAAAHYISVRHLYKVLADAEISLSEWIRTHRLEACRHDLSRNAYPTIASVARRRGFTDMSSFSRAFRAEYGVSPKEWRRHHNRQPWEAEPAADSADQPGDHDLRAAAPRRNTPPADGAAEQRSEQPLGQLLDWMHRNSAAPLTLSTMAARASVSVRTLNRQFRDHLDTTPLGYLTQLRVDRARQLLDTTDLTMDRIAERCGFGSYDSLRYHFIRTAGVTPGEYRTGDTMQTADPGQSTPS
ncbi:helix-turn-helix domain-containing protein [Mycobacterium sp.]|uniref:helix-turn-helix domain-containing protein n=1 Tax=Mycobacterium sp. TaxID=1785 RepID=UPI002C70CDFF|nr:helix-turn-helix domain-containing protein [Mycobacterium sp.]HKP39894.1 helix-turn-helix domain-containing protein [Mycobacterium sp.]